MIAGGPHEQGTEIDEPGRAGQRILRRMLNLARPGVALIN
jgi:hypothetical protein